jgi:hypothetical protein
MATHLVLSHQECDDGSVNLNRAERELGLAYFSLNRHLAVADLSSEIVPPLLTLVHQVCP